MKGYGQHCPISRTAEILATRWTPIIVRNLLLGCESFSEIAEGAPGIPRSVLSDRLRMLHRHGLVERTPRRGYRLTDAGAELQTVLDAMGVWGTRWLEVAPKDLGAHIVLWSMCRLMEHQGQLPDRRVVLRFDLSDGETRRFWIVLERPRAEVCVKPPGFDIDVVVSTDTYWLAMWHAGRIPLSAAVRRKLIRVEGSPALKRALATWGISPFAGIAPAA